MQKQFRKLANLLTIIRAIGALPLLTALYFENYSLAWIILLGAGLTDLADGFFARKAGGGTTWGARLDPLADKIIISAVLIWLVSKLILPFWAVWVLLTRELIVSSWRSQDYKGGAASKSGKLKTVLQFMSILLMIWPTSLGGRIVAINAQKIGLIIFWPSLLIALISAIGYFKYQIKSDLN